MKKFALIITVFCILSIALSAQNEVLVGWTFPGNSAVADMGIDVNLDEEIFTMGGTSDIEFKNGFATKAAQATGWNDGMDLKAWILSFSSEGYSDLTISSRQQSGGNEPGPENFNIQYSNDAGSTWIDVVSGDIIVENDWETAFVDNLSLPYECQDQAELMIRWIMTTNEASGAGGEVLESGKSKIDEIYIRGEVINGWEEIHDINFTLSPNPATDYITIHSDVQIDNLVIYDLSGRQILQKQSLENIVKIDVSGIAKGAYILSIKSFDKSIIQTRKITIQ